MPRQIVVTRRQASRFNVDNLVDIIEYQGVRRDWLARQMGYHESALSLVINGKRRPSPAFIARACTALRLPPHILFSYRPDDDAPAPRKRA